jgi:hypothetical protein
MRMQTAEVGEYKLIIYRNNAGLWEFSIKQKGHVLVKSTGTADCEETKLMAQKHLYDIVMSKKEKKHFDPAAELTWHNYLHEGGFGPELAG